MSTVTAYGVCLLLFYRHAAPLGLWVWRGLRHTEYAYYYSIDMPPLWGLVWRGLRHTEYAYYYSIDMPPLWGFGYGAGYGIRSMPFTIL